MQTKRIRFPKISILTPSFNKKEYIEKAIRSVISQRYPNLEHIIIDGVSTDGTLDILKKYASYKHIKIIIEKDRNHIEALNKALKYVTGEIISVLNADDYYETDAFKIIAKEFLSNKKVDVVVGNCRIIDMNGTLIRISKPQVELKKILLPWKYEFPVNPSSYFYKNVHNKIGLFDEKYGLEFDFEFFLRLARYCRIKYIDENIGNFRYYFDSKTFINSENTLSNLNRISFDYSNKTNYINLYEKLIIRSLHVLFNIRKYIFIKFNERVLKIWCKLSKFKREIVRVITFKRLPINKDGKILLNLGSGDSYDERFINIDIRSSKQTHYVHSVESLVNFDNNSVDFIYASHLLEHLPYNNVLSVLAEWQRVLKKDGILRLSVPDFEKIINLYVKTKDITLVRQPLLGGQDYQYNFHYGIYTYSYLAELLQKVGFRKTRMWRPDEYTKNFNDWSTKKIQEKYFISLNIEAIK